MNTTDIIEKAPAAPALGGVLRTGMTRDEIRAAISRALEGVALTEEHQATADDIADRLSRLEPRPDVPARASREEILARAAVWRQ